MELLEFINSDEFRNLKHIPITPQRAYSQVKNPRAQKDDVLLIIAYNSENELIGYSGILPDKIFINHYSRRICWNSCWWVHPEKGKSAAIPLFLKVCKVCKNQLIFADLAPASRKIIEKMEYFTSPAKIEGLRGICRSYLAELLPGKRKYFRYFKFILQMMDATVNLISELKSKSAIRKFKHLNTEIEYIDHIDPDTAGFIEKHSQNELLKRSYEELNWILKYKWILNTAHQEDLNSQRYYFSSITKHFSFFAVKIIQNNELAAFLLLSERDGHVKIPYLYYPKQNKELVLKFIFGFLFNRKAKSFITFRTDLMDFFQCNNTPFIKKMYIQRYFSISRDFEEVKLNKSLFQDGDGDFVFT